MFNLPSQFSSRPRSSRHRSRPTRLISGSLILLSILCLLTAMPAEAKPFVKGRNIFSRLGVNATFPFGRGLVESIAKAIGRSVKFTAKATKESFVFCIHAPQILINGVVSTSDVILYEADHHFHEVVDDPKHFGAGFDGTDIKPIVQYSEASH